MIITDVTVDVLRVPDFAVREDASLEAVVVRVVTDEGITGVGDACSSPHITKAIIDAPTYFTLSRAIRELLVGRDPFEIGLLWEEIYRMTHYPGRRGALIHALSAIDIALWDVMGKAVGLPVHTLLGGAFQREVPVYASLVMPDTSAEVRALAERTAAAGWGVLKMGWFPYRNDDAADLALVRAAREGAGPDVKVALDVGPRWDTTRGGAPAVRLWDAKTAIRNIRRWEEYDPFWIEEPLPADDLDGYARLTAAVEPYIASGEMESTRFPLIELMDRGNIDIVQLDIGRVGGLTEGRRVVHAAQDRNRLVALHSYTNAVGLAAAAHLMAAAPTGFYLEVPVPGSALIHDLAYPRLEVRDGKLRVPDGPGLGISVDDELVDRLSVFGPTERHTQWT